MTMFFSPSPRLARLVLCGSALGLALQSAPVLAQDQPNPKAQAQTKSKPASVSGASNQTAKPANKALGMTKAPRAAQEGQVLTGEPFQNKQELSDWMTRYYQQPQPERMLQAIRFMHERRLLAQPVAMSTMIGFFSGVLHNNPNKAREWIEYLRARLMGQDFYAVLLGLWYANIPASDALVMESLDLVPELQSELQFAYIYKPEPVEKIDLDAGPHVIDTLWGKFLATGRTEPVARIVEALPWQDLPESEAKRLVGNYADASLRSNIQTHPRVRQIVEQLSSTVPPEQARKLNVVLARATQSAASEPKP